MSDDNGYSFMIDWSKSLKAIKLCDLLTYAVETYCKIYSKILLYLS